MNNLTFLHEIAQKAVRAVAGAAFAEDSEFLKAEVSQSTQPQFGHYQCNNALKLGKALKKNPRDIALQLIAHFDRTLNGHAFIDQLEIAG